jgi:hypothetical protein
MSADKRMLKFKFIVHVYESYDSECEFESDHYESEILLYMEDKMKKHVTGNSIPLKVFKNGRALYNKMENGFGFREQCDKYGIEFLTLLNSGDLEDFGRYGFVMFKNKPEMPESDRPRPWREKHYWSLTSVTVV